MGEAIKILKPLLGEGAKIKAHGVVIGTVKGNFHDIGKNLVAMMLESPGMTVHTLGDDFCMNYLKGLPAEVIQR